MKRSDHNREFLFRHTLIPVLTAVVMAGVLAVSIWLHDGQADRFEQVTVNQDAMHSDYDALIYRRRLIDRYHNRYQQFRRLGFIGVEDRVDWVETLRETRQDLVLPRVSYALEPQLRAIAPVESYMAGEETHVHLSRMQLQVGLIHEIDLLRFVDEVQSNAPGLVTVDGCELSWLREGDRVSTTEANILASCAFRIFSIVTSDVSPGGSS